MSNFDWRDLLLVLGIVLFVYCVIGLSSIYRRRSRYEARRRRKLITRMTNRGNRVLNAMLKAVRESNHQNLEVVPFARQDDEYGITVRKKGGGFGSEFVTIHFEIQSNDASVYRRPEMWREEKHDFSEEGARRLIEDLSAFVKNLSALKPSAA